MTPSLAPDFIPEIQVVHDRIMTTSLAISNVFEKNHRDVLRSIKDLEIPEDYRERNFAPTFREVPGPNGSLRKEPMYLITRDGFTILAMGFTGKRAMEFKIKYIEAFNRMEEELRRRKEPPAIPQDPPKITFIQRRILSEIVTSRSHLLHFDQRDPMMARMWKGLLDHFRIERLDDLPEHLFHSARSFLETFPVEIPETRPPGIPYEPRPKTKTRPLQRTVVSEGDRLSLDFPKETAKPSRSFWKDLPPDAPKDGLSVQDLLDPDYPDPLRQAIDRIEAAGFDANGLRVQYEAMKGHLRSAAKAFEEIYQISRVRRMP